MDLNVMNDVKYSSPVFPLLIAGFFLQAFGPLFSQQLYVALLIDDFGDALIACSLFFCIPYKLLYLKTLSGAFLTWSFFSFLSNLTLEIGLPNHGKWQLFIAGICLCVFGLLSSGVINIAKFEKGQTNDES